MEKSRLSIEMDAVGDGLRAFVKEAISNLDTNPVMGMMIRDKINELQLFYSNQYLASKVHSLLSEKYPEVAEDPPTEVAE